MVLNQQRLSTLVYSKIGKKLEQLERMAFSPDGKHWAFQGKTLVIDGKAIPEVETARHITFSPDGNYIAYVANGPVGTCVVVNGNKGQAGSRIIVPPHFDSSNTLSYYATGFTGERSCQWIQESLTPLK